MRQVPVIPSFSAYGLVGSGQLAYHFAHYLRLLHIPFICWSRDLKTPIAQALQNCSHILVLITDSQIEAFLTENQNKLPNATFIHCSGSLFTPLAVGVHPLMTFSKTLYDEKTYRDIHFVVDSQKQPLSSLLPQLPNSYSMIDPSQKAQYHALCVMAGNFSSLLWQEFFTQMQEHLGISKQHTLPYLHQIFHNIASMENSFTGPIQRGDQQTINKHLKVLEEKPHLYHIYQAFLKWKGGQT